MLKIFIYILISFTLFIFYVTNTLIMEPYMDEIFHFPQAVKYYKGIYKEWDPKITTPPGLYLFTVGILNPVSKITNLDVDKLACFRLVNLCFTIGTIYVVYRILQHHHKENESRILLLSSFNITIFPVLYFFNFLYYTECGSTFFVLLMYYWHLKKFYFAASFPAVVALLFRQTNIVWIFYIAAEETLQTLFEFSKESLSKKDKKLNFFSVSAFRVFIPLWMKNWKQILQKIFEINIGYIPIAIGSVAFVFYNGSIALGDKTAHEVCVHIPQLFYFLLFFLFFCSAYLISISKAKQFLKFIFTEKILVFELVVFSAFAITYMSHVHPYLLADNRHYTFYVWRKILGKNIFVSLALIPLYMYSGYSLINSLQHKNIIFKFIIAFCITVSVIPQKLFEFRYFIVPYIMLRIHLKAKYPWQPYLEFILYFVINFLVLYLFLFQKLPWESTEKLVRIMW